VFDINSRAILRTLDSHKQPVHVAKFSSLAPTQALSCSDDTTIKLWDIPSQSAIATFSSHTDYVRSGQVSTSNPHLVLTGSYDATMRLFDSRTGQCEMVMGGNNACGAASSTTPIEQVLMFPSGTVALSAAGPILRTWDLVAGGRCTRALSNHQKTITSLAFDASAGRLLTGALDHMVKVYDVSTYKVVHTMRYPAAILCLDVSVCPFCSTCDHNLTCSKPDDTHIAAGMSDGTLSVRRRQPRVSEAAASDLPFSPATLRSGTFESFLGGALPAIGQGHARDKRKGKAISGGDVDELRVESRRTKRLKEFDRLLKGFKYSAALDSVLLKVN